ncbi:mediator of RNA polymerase II transcription subunit 12-like protein isoform X1 [Cinnamomum micranthum f. kanehirae]|uniref:Mediator of RNA polymerase II transcription subunit 12-like protein isoform X1 n=1 Tax=Cinnamomum micranthum f. kanehirae TaxID=337451 RepID=A0A3S3NB75_9MAGN|nr:mediator of RNA polymerase II transcription subunit 12-like protein isoform X1 [Cinnamomum micranthum f. kanehirae]
MQRFSAASYGGGVNNSAVGGTSSRDTARADSSFSSSNFSLSSRRSLPLTPYKLKCDKESLNCRLGPPDYYPQTSNCPEETLTREYLQVGYKEIVEGIEESKETALSYVASLTTDDIVKCKEAIRRRLRAINESRAQKRKAGQVYGVPLSGPLLNKSGVFPEQRNCGEDFRKKWIEGLSQHHKRLHSLAEHVPHGFRKKHLFEVLIRHNVPLLRATWFIKVTYLNQVRPTSSSVSSGTPDRTLLARTELWTKDVIEYLQCLLEEYTSTSLSYGRDQSSQTLLVSSAQHKGGSLPVIADGEEPTLQFKWRYMVRILQWHQAEGLLFCSHIIEWVLSQLQGKESVDVLQLLLPIVFNVIDSIALSQTYVRMLVEIAVHSIQSLSQASPADAVDNSRKPYVLSVLVEMIRYLILAVPDTFVALDCFPLPSSVVPDFINGRNFLLVGLEKYQYGPQEISNIYNGKGHDAFHRYMSFGYVVSSLQRRAANLALAVSPGSQGHGVVKVVQALDGVLTLGDVRVAYTSLFENLFDGGVEEGWIAEVSPSLRSSLKWIGTVSPSVVCSVFLLCEWATCDFRDCRTALPHDLKFTGRKDFSQVYIAVLLLKLRREDMHRSLQSRTGNNFPGDAFAKGSSLHDSGSAGTTIDNASEFRNGLKNSEESEGTKDILQSPGPLHDIVVCWLDQHEASREGFKRLQMLIVELIRFGIFYPQAYVRQLIVSGLMDRNGSPVDLDRQKRHYRILKQLPGSYLFDALKEAKIADASHLFEAVRIYSNERRLVLNGLLSGHPSYLKAANGSSFNFDLKKQRDNATAGRDSASPATLDHRKKSHLACSPLPIKHEKRKGKVEELKGAIAILLHFPSICSASIDGHADESQVSLKRSVGSLVTKIDTTDGTPGCEECRRAKRQKGSEDRNNLLQGVLPNPSDEEDTWWVRKGPKPLDTPKVDPPLKPTKPPSRGRRKTQSLAHLASARIEGSQGASTSHVCDNKINCPHHRTGMEGETSKSMDGNKSLHLSDVVNIGKALKQLRLLERRYITLWLIASVRQLVEGDEKAVAKVSQCTSPFSPIDDGSSVRWRLGEDELSFILYLLDVSSDLFSAVKFLLWLLPKALPSPNSGVHGGRNILVPNRNSESNVCEVREAFLLSSIRRYENILIAADLLPEALSAAMLRALAVMISNGRASLSTAFIYGRHLLKKFGSVASVAKWEKSFKSSCDQRLLSELETGRPLDSELGFSLVGVAAGVEDVDDYFRQRITARTRTAPTMKERVHKHVEEAVHYFCGKERKPFVATAPKGSCGIEKRDDAFQIAHQIVLDCVRQNGGAAQEWDPSVVASAISAIVGNVGQVVATLLDTAAGSYPPTISSLGCARHVVRIHINSLCLLKEALGERQSRVFEVALATEASSAVSAYTSGKAPHNQFQLSPETHDSSANMSNEILNGPAKMFIGRAAKIAAAVSAVVIGAVVHGVASLERMITVLRLKEGLDILQFIRGVRSSSNGISRSIGAFKSENGIEVCLHWFRLLVGDCRAVSDGLVVELLGETYVLALSRMQRMLPLNLVLPPAYSIFTMVIWRSYFNTNTANREDIQMYQSLSLAIIRHQPFRDVCLRDSHTLYDLLVSDVGDSEFAAMRELHSPVKNLKTTALVPLRARLFLNAILDCRLPQFPLMQDDGAWVPGHGDSKVYAGNEKPRDQLVHVLDSLQLAKFHWQWIELRLILNERVLIEKIETQNMSLVEAVRSLSPNAENDELCECENNFTKIVLTRLPVRPDAAPLYSEVIHLFGRMFEESLLLNAKWFLAGSDVLLGRKSITQRLTNVAQQGGFSTKVQFWKPWGWSSSVADQSAHRGEKRKLEATSLEEGEVVEEGTDVKRLGRSSAQMFDVEGFSSSKLYVTEKALAELVLPCMDQSSNESRNTFASELIKQMNTIEQQISMLTRGATKQAGPAPSGVEGAAIKNSTRKGIRGGSPGLSRRPTGVADSAPPSAAALRASMWLRLQFILRLLPVIYADREPSSRNMRHMLASVLLRLLGTRVVHEDADHSFFPVLRNSLSRREVEPLIDVSVATPLDLSGDSLFDWFLCVLHGLLSSCKPSWLKPKSTSKSTVKSPRDFSVFEREAAESLQTDLDRMQLPTAIRRRLQAAIPVLPPSLPPSISCQPPLLSSAALASMQSSLPSPGFQAGNSNPPQRSPVPSARTSSNASAKSRPLQSQDPDVEIDPWMLLEDGTGSVPVSGNSNVSVGSDHANLKACSWLKGAIRVRRTDLTYIGTVDDDS